MTTIRRLYRNYPDFKTREGRRPEDPGTYGRSIVKVNFRRGYPVGRIWEYHYTKGWRSYTRPLAVAWSAI